MTTIRILIDGKERLNKDVADVERAINTIRQWLPGAAPRHSELRGRVALISETDNVTRLWPLKAA